MNKKSVFIIITIIFLALVFFLVKNKPVTTPTPPSNQLQIISTKPSPLDEATILPTQNIEITFNKEIVLSEFKHKFDPEVEYETEVIDGKNNLGKTFRIKFKKSLQLGSGYTLFILKETHTEDKELLDKEYVFHIKTINYRGV